MINGRYTGLIVFKDIIFQDRRKSKCQQKMRLTSNRPFAIRTLSRRQAQSRDEENKALHIPLKILNHG